jgi:hypothetical protein
MSLGKRPTALRSDMDVRQPARPRAGATRLVHAPDVLEDSSTDSDYLHEERPPTSILQRGAIRQPEARQAAAAAATALADQHGHTMVRSARHHPYVTLAIGALAALIVWWIAMDLLAWWSVTANDIHYGRPRTYQTDAYVGHNEQPGQPSHFIAINLQRRVVVIEFPGGDPTKDKVYLGPYLFGDGQDLTPVTLSFRDLNGDGHPDMILHIGNQEVVYINDIATQSFRPLTPAERGIIEQHLGSGQ